MKQKIVITFGAFFALLFSFFYTGTMTVEATEYPIYAALGDSVPAGVRLEDYDDTRDPIKNPTIFPATSYVGVFSEELKIEIPNLVTYNYAKSGWTSEDLLEALKGDTGEALKKDADRIRVVTVDIGGNNLQKPLLEILEARIEHGMPWSNGDLTEAIKVEMDEAEEAKMQEGLDQFAEDFPLIISWLHENLPQADIIVSNIYNPLPITGPFIDSAKPYLDALNDVILNPENYKLGSYMIVDTNDAFNKAQKVVLNFNLSNSDIDSHPNVDGHALMATLHMEAYTEAQKLKEEHPVVFPTNIIMDYGETLREAGWSNASGMGTFAFDQAVHIPSVGKSQGFSMTFTPTDDSFIYTGYEGWNSATNTITRTVNVDVNKVLLEVIANDKTKLSRADNPTFDVRYVGLVNKDEGELLIPLSTITFSCDADELSNPGNYKIVPSERGELDLQNYVVAFSEGTLTVEENPAITTLEAVIRKAQNIVNGGEFTRESKKNAEALIKEAEELVKTGMEDEILLQITKLEGIESILVSVAELNDAIKEAQDAINKGDFTKSSVEQLEALIEEAQALLINGTRADILQKVGNLSTGKVDLVPIQVTIITEFPVWRGTGEVFAKLDADYADYIQLINNGNVIKDVKVTSGSTILTFSEAFLKTLEPNATYIFRAEFKEGRYADLKLVTNRPEVGKETSDKENPAQAGNTAGSTTPKTGDMNNVLVYVVLLGIGAVVIVVLLVKKSIGKRKK